MDAKARIMNDALVQMAGRPPLAAQHDHTDGRTRLAPSFPHIATQTPPPDEPCAPLATHLLTRGLGFGKDAPQRLVLRPRPLRPRPLPRSRVQGEAASRAGALAPTPPWVIIPPSPRACLRWPRRPPHGAILLIRSDRVKARAHIQVLGAPPLETCSRAVVFKKRLAASRRPSTCRLSGRAQYSQTGRCSARATPPCPAAGNFPWPTAMLAHFKRQLLVGGFWWPASSHRAQRSTGPVQACGCTLPAPDSRGCGAVHLR